jgi:4'-phosphopantetheinyl transferase
MKTERHRWLTPPSIVEADRTSVHVWLAALNISDMHRQKLELMLSQDEHQRAQQFYFERDRCQFVVARGLLRALVGQYLQVAPSTINFNYGPHGKPELPRGHNDALHFNLSHSHGLAVFAFAWEREVGIDIEYMRPLEDLESIAQQFFSEQEQFILQNLPTPLKQQGFYNCWTRKEAYIKATGMGLSQPLDEFAVSLAPHEPAQLLHAQGKPDEAKQWSLHELRPPAGYAAALAVAGPDAKLTCWRWDEMRLR